MASVSSIPGGLHFELGSVPTEGGEIRDDLAGLRVWVSTSSGFTPTGTPTYEGTDLYCNIYGLSPGTPYYLRYAVKSILETDSSELSISATEYTVTPQALSIPGLAIKPNYASYTGANGGECYLHGYDSTGQAANVDGYIYYGGTKITVPKGYYINPPDGTFYILFDTSLSNPWPGPTGTAASSSVITAVKSAGSWTGKTNNTSTSFPITITSTMIVIGEVTNLSENITHAVVWGDGRNPSSISDNGATVGAPTGTLVGSTLAEVVESNSATGAGKSTLYRTHSTAKPSTTSHPKLKVDDLLYTTDEGRYYQCTATGTPATWTTNTVTATDITTGTLSADRIAAGSITGTKLDVDAIRGKSVVGSNIMTKGSRLASAASSGATTLTLENVSDFPNSGYGFIVAMNAWDSLNISGLLRFTYSGRNTTTRQLTGCTGTTTSDGEVLVVGTSVLPEDECMVFDPAVGQLRLFGDLVGIANPGDYSQVASLGLPTSGVAGGGGVVAELGNVEADITVLRSSTKGGISIYGNCYGVDCGVGVMAMAHNGGVPLQIEPVNWFPVAGYENTLTNGATAILTGTPGFCMYDGTNWQTLVGTQYLGGYGHKIDNSRFTFSNFDAGTSNIVQTSFQYGYRVELTNANPITGFSAFSVSSTLPTSVADTRVIAFNGQYPKRTGLPISLTYTSLYNHIATYEFAYLASTSPELRGIHKGAACIVSGSTNGLDNTAGDISYFINVQNSTLSPTVTSSTGSPLVTFSSAVTLASGATLYSNLGTLIGTVAYSAVSSTTFTLTSNASVSLTTQSGCTYSSSAILIYTNSTNISRASDTGTLSAYSNVYNDYYNGTGINYYAGKSTFADTLHCLSSVKIEGSLYTSGNIVSLDGSTIGIYPYTATGNDYSYAYVGYPSTSKSATVYAYGNNHTTYPGCNRLTGTGYTQVSSTQGLQVTNNSSTYPTVSATQGGSAAVSKLYMESGSYADDFVEVIQNLGTITDEAATSYGCILLARKASTGVGSSGIVGTITIHRGTSVYQNRLARYSIMARSTNGNDNTDIKLDHISGGSTTGMLYELGTATVGGVEYIAARRQTASAVATSVQVAGLVWETTDSTLPKLVADSSVTAYTVISKPSTTLTFTSSTGTTSDYADSLDTITGNKIFGVGPSTTAAPVTSADGCGIQLSTVGQTTQLVIMGSGASAGGIYIRTDDGGGYDTWTQTAARNVANTFTAQNTFVNTTTALVLNTYSSTTDIHSIAQSRALGSSETPTATTTNTRLASFAARGHNGTAFHTNYSGRVQFTAAEAGGTGNGAHFDVLVSSTGADSACVQHTRFAASGRLLVGTTTDDGTNKLQVSGSASCSGAISSASTITGSIISSTGGGVAFPASQVASANANTLDDYEEGSWASPSLVNYTTTGSPTVSATYVKIGKLVVCRGTITCSAGNTVASTANSSYISGLPFTPATASSGSFAGATMAVSGSGNVTTTARFYTPTFSAQSNSINFSFSYEVA